MTDTPPPPNPTAQQIFDAGKRKRKPLVDLNADEKARATAKLLAEKDATIDNLTRQLRKLQEAATASTGYVKSLEEQLRVANAPRPAPIAAPTTTAEPPRAKRQRVEPEPDTKAPDTAPKTEDQATTTPDTTQP